MNVRAPSFETAVEALTGAPITEGNAAECFFNGDQVFPALVDTIASAETSVDFVTYLYGRGEVPRWVTGALCERARAGVEVNVLLDAVGSRWIERPLLQEMAAASVGIRTFRPLTRRTGRRFTHRTHRKLLIVDGSVGMIGGAGIDDRWQGDAQSPRHWRDTHVRVRGPVVASLSAAFAEHWWAATGELLAGSRPPTLAPADRGAPMQLVRSSGGIADTRIESLYVLAIACARTSIRLTTGYYSPPPTLVRELAAAAGRGVDVQILVPGDHSDSRRALLAGRRSYTQLMARGARIWEYGPTMLHAKTLTIDGAWAAVGSVNCDNLSFRMLEEAVLCVSSEHLAHALDEQFARDLGCSLEIDVARWRVRPLRARVEERLAATTWRML